MSEIPTAILGSCGLRMRDEVVFTHRVIVRLPALKTVAECFVLIQPRSTKGQHRCSFRKRLSAITRIKRGLKPTAIRELMVNKVSR